MALVVYLADIVRVYYACLVSMCCLFLQVNIDHQTSREIVENMRAPDRATFTRAQQSIYLLMARDSFVRFIKSEQFQQALKRSQ